MKCLVIGGAGFIWSHTVDALLEKGYDVRILDNLSHPAHTKGKPSYLPQDAEFMLGDVCNKENLRKALQNVDVIFHFAAHNSYSSDFSYVFQVNCVSTALLYEIIVEDKLDIKKVIVASSQAVYGEGKYRCPNCNRIKYPNIRSLAQLEKGECELFCDSCNGMLQAMWTNENRVNPQSQYAISKHTQELTSLSLAKRYNIPTCCLRYSNVQGSRQSIFSGYSGACRIFCVNQFFDKQPSIYEDGKQKRDFVNVKDVVAANLVVLKSPKADYKAFNVGGGKTYSIIEFANMVSGIFNKNIKAKFTGEYRFGDTRHIFSDISHLKELGWKPRFSPEVSIREFVNWVNELKDVKNVLADAEEQMRLFKILRN